MSIDIGILGHLRRAVILLLFVAGLMLVAVEYMPLIQQNERMRKEILRQDGEIQRAEEQGKQLKNAIDALRHDPKTVERLARERLGYVKPGETVIRFEAPVTNTSTHD